MSSPLRVLVTGAAGFIGSHVAEELVRRGHDVVGVDNFLTGRRENFPACVRFDISTGESHPDWEQPDVVVHAAASYDDGENWRRDISTNVLGAEWVCRLKPKRIVYFQTALCYGHDPYVGGEQRPLSLDTPLAPDNSYAISKTAGESYLLHSGIPTVSLRLANIYGPRNLSGPIPTFYKRLSEGDTCIVADSRRDFVYVGDLLRVAIPAIEGRGEGIYHVSSGRDYRISEVFYTVCDALDRKSLRPGVVEFRERAPGDSPAILLDPARTELHFRWMPEVKLAEGIRQAVAWYRENGVERTFTHLEFKG